MNEALALHEREERVRAVPSEPTHEELLRSTELKDAYLLALAHDLRSPVSMLMALADLLKTDTRDSHRVGLIGDVLGQAVREIDQIISDLLDVERLEHRGVEVSRAPTDLTRLLAECVESAGVEKMVELDVRTGNANLDRAMVKRILVNVLANAREHSPLGGTVRLRASAEGEALVITVDDDGPGIPDKAKEAAFDLFEQLRSDGPGVGVGLHLVRRFAELHGGGASIGDSPTGGASVRVWLGTRADG